MNDPDPVREEGGLPKIGLEVGLASIREGVPMKISARNNIPGKVTHVKLGPVSAEVTINVAPGIDIVSVISTTVRGTARAQSRPPAYAIIKASSVMVGVDHA